MTVSQSSLTVLRILVCIAQVSNDLQPLQYAMLAQILQQISPHPEGLTVERLLVEKISLSPLLEEIQNRDTQIEVYNTACSFAHIARITPKQQRLLEQIRTTFQLPSVSALQENADADRELLTDSFLLKPAVTGIRIIIHYNRKIRNLILDYAIGAAIIGAIPISGFLILQLLATSVLIGKMVWDIDAMWGFPKGWDFLATVGKFFGSLGALAIAFMSWLTVFCIGLIIPYVGRLALAAALFTLTWVVGQINNQYHISSYRLDTAALSKALHRSAKQRKRHWRAR
ncbi:hypothetical protein [Scytonema sp. UIC 10036]|uniref:hypothetical protein n=1 Tax=Scytonema sp. UIC 10036 TaxID=2304196 RepID=UPI001A9AE46A|nr:hypothetical protein [Scytonema sp. UIC 10036]